MTCEKCGRETEGHRRSGPGHPRIPYCTVCFYPKRLAYCDCGGVKSAGAKRCRVCVAQPSIARMEKRIQSLRDQLSKQEEKLKALREKLEPSESELEPAVRRDDGPKIF